MYGWTEDPTGETAHRPWPIPTEPWLMAQRWSDLLFAHWPLPADTVRALVPSLLPIDTYNGTAWISLASFRLSHLRAHWLPALPWISEFPELNVRTYTSLGGKPGVYFFSLDARSALAVAAARATYHLPYFRADMSVRRAGDLIVTYTSRRTDRRGRPAEFQAQYRPTGPVNHPPRGTLDHWLSERYCLYSVDRALRVYRAEIHHRPWPLQPADARIDVDTMASASGLDTGGPPARIAFASMLDVVVWAPHLVG